ncbi:MAG: hypothetical protein HRT37_26620 [Alteromonadaceae bacterium]|nr:hypothetical protein [Alteromonadaceae bacterium]
MSQLLTLFASNNILSEAYNWLCNGRVKTHHNNDVWVRHEVIYVFIGTA